ncbi:Lysine-rich nucleolar protein 1 [Galemys pyrenaicus]|uniref:Lysine-rich nucleolar protein 1 n=1 Tax=Galemys pyrenaicus TaxID=202257 RepID=A0A8J6A4G2_GALPY|nr:Lysine-rich nucleolar protein 1 [Galemys pyrenaicus]
MHPRIRAARRGALGRPWWACTQTASSVCGNTWLSFFPGMITKTHKGDVSPGLPEKKKKKKKKVLKEPETQYSLLHSDNYFTEVFPIKATTPSKSAVQGPVPEMPLVKKKKKKKKKAACEELLERDPLSPARRVKSPSPRKQVLGPSEILIGEKKRKSVWPLATCPDARAKSSLDPRQGEEITRVGRKLKKHKKEKKAQEPVLCSAKDPWSCKAGGTPCPCSVGRDDEQAASGQKRKQGSPRERSVKIKKKKKICQEGDTLLGYPKLSRSMESSPRKGSSKKKSLKVEAPEYIPIGDGAKASTKKKLKTKKTELPGVEEPALKKKKKKRKDSSVAGKPQEQEEEPDTDLEVVLERKGNMDEAHVDQVRRKALQEEIDRESGKTEGSESKKRMLGCKLEAASCKPESAGPSLVRLGSGEESGFGIQKNNPLLSQGTRFGQWDTADFENEEKKLKFLKLMGGFKNLSPSLGRSSVVGRPNMALNKKAADTLQQDLQRDYDRAMSWKHSRGAGLGFSSTPDKIFFIDRNASKSIKFED